MRARLSLIIPFILLFAAACGTPTPAPSLPTLAMLPSLTPTLTETPAPTTTYTPTFTLTWTPSPTLTETPTLTPSETPSPTPSPTFTLTPTEIYAEFGALVGTLEGVHEEAFISGFERHVYTFEGRAGEWVTITMRSDAPAVAPAVDPAVDPVVMLVNPDGQPLAIDDDSGAGGSALLRGVQLQQTGTQIVVATGGGFGRYVIRLQRSNEPPFVTPIPPQPTPTLPSGSVTPAPHTAALRDHVPISALLESRGFDRYFIDAEAGAFITIGAAAAAPSANLRLEVYNPAGEALVSLNARESAAGGGALIPALGVIETGTYTVIVTDDARIGGVYTISYGLGGSHSDVLRGAVAPESPVRGDVRQRGWRDVWSIYLNQGDRFALDLFVDNAGFDAAVAVIAPIGAPDGSQIAAAAMADAPISDVRAPVGGWYTIRVDGAFARTYGSYSLTWRLLEAAPTATPLPGAIPILTAETTLPADRADGLSYPFQGQAGARIRIRVIGLDGVDPLAELRDPAGEVIARSDDAEGLNPLIDVTLPADGTYTVEVNDYGDTGGAIRLTVERMVSAET